MITRAEWLRKAVSGFFQGLTELAQHLAMMAVGKLVSDRQDQRQRPLDDLQGGRYADAAEKGELLRRRQLKTRAGHVESHGVVCDCAFSRRAGRLRVRARATGLDGAGLPWGDRCCGHAVVHVTLGLLAGRTDETKVRLTEAVPELLRAYAKPGAGVALHASAEVRDLDPSYRKSEV